MKRKYWQAAIEVKVAVLLFLGIGLTWTLIVLIPVLAANASGRTFLLPVTSIVLGGLVAAEILLKMPSSRIAGMVVAILFGVVHALGLLAAQLWWVKVFSGIAFACYVYAAVLLNSMPLRRHLLGANA
jgi:hypothetical protein